MSRRGWIKTAAGGVAGLALFGYWALQPKRTQTPKSTQAPKSTQKPAISPPPQQITEGAVAKLQKIIQNLRTLSKTEQRTLYNEILKAQYSLQGNLLIDETQRILKAVDIEVFHGAPGLDLSGESLYIAHLDKIFMSQTHHIDGFFKSLYGEPAESAKAHEYLHAVQERNSFHYEFMHFLYRQKHPLKKGGTQTILSFNPGQKKSTLSFEDFDVFENSVFLDDFYSRLLPHDQRDVDSILDPKEKLTALKLGLLKRIQIFFEVDAPQVLGIREIGAYYAFCLLNTERFFELIQNNPAFGGKLLGVLSKEKSEMYRRNILFRYAYRNNDSIQVAKDVGQLGTSLDEDNVRILHELYPDKAERKAYYEEMIKKRQQDMHRALIEISKVTQDVLIQNKLMQESDRFEMLIDENGFWSEENYIVTLNL